MDERLFKIMKRRLKYNDNDYALFVKNEKNKDVLSKYKEIAGIRIIVELVSARGCNSQHTEGQKFYFDGAGNLLTKESPQKICIFLLGNMPPLFFAIQELLYGGIKPEDIDLKFPHVGCMDVGVENCGWGKVIANVKVERA